MRRSFHALLWLLVVILLSKAALDLLEDRRAELPDGGPTATVILVRLDDDGEALPAGRQGCGEEFVPHDIPVVSARLTSVLSALSRFDPPEGLRNPMKEHGITVVGVRNGIIDLAGNPSLGGLCDRPRLKGQIERTVALHMEGDVEIRLNGSAEEYRCMRDVWGKCG